MADKRQVHHSLRQLQSVKTWQLVIVLILVGFVAATFLRLNNIGMDQRRKAVLSADQTGDSETIKSRLFELQSYVASHMNADMGSIYLENQYKRDSQKAIDAASNSGNANGNIYKKAQDECRPKFTRYNQAYLQCTVNYLAQFAPSDNPASTVALPKADMYRHSYSSPLWSPDFAGFTVLICLFIIFIIIARLIGIFALRMVLRARNR